MSKYKHTHTIEQTTHQTDLKTLPWNMYTGVTTSDHQKIDSKTRISFIVNAQRGKKEDREEEGKVGKQDSTYGTSASHIQWREFNRGTIEAP